MVNPNAIPEAEKYINEEIKQRSSLKRFEEWHNNYLKNILLRAQMDGQKGIPSDTDTSICIHEQKIVSEYTQKLQEIIQPGIHILNILNDGPLKNLKTQIDNEDKERVTLKEAHTTRINKQIQNQQDTYNTEVQTLNSRKQSTEKELHEIQLKFNNKKIEHGREHLNNRWNPIICWIIILVLAFVEAPLNSKIFQFFKLNNWETYLTSGILIIGFPVLSHFAGLAFHKGKSKEPNYYAAIPILLFIVVFCLTINLFRIDFLDQLSHSDEVGYKGITLSAIFSKTQFWMAFIINIALFVFGIILSYNMHDTDYDFEKVHNEYHKKKPKLDIELDNITDDINSAKNIFHQKLVKLNTEISNADKEVEDQLKKRKHDYNIIVSLYDSVVIYLKEVEKQVNQHHITAMLEYRNINQTNRTIGNPVYWSTKINDLEKKFSEFNYNEINP